MSSDLGPTGLEQVLRHERGLRRLAGALLVDPADADDAVQHALTQAAMGRRRPDTPLWPFLRTALRHHADNLRRFAARRRAHERLAARAEAVPSAADFAARDQLRRRVADAVQALDEPYRTTVWLRWFEELDSAAVAARMGVPVATVRTRLQRAHGQLAARLDRDYGERRAWVLLARPFGPGVSVAAVAAISSGIAMKKILAAAVVLLPLALAYTLLPTPGDPAPATKTVASPPTAASAELPARPGERRELDVVSPAAPAALLAVQFADGTPARGLPVWFWADDATRPIWTRRVDRSRDRDVGDGIVNAAEEPKPSAPPLTTDGDGRVALPADASMAAVVAIQYAPEQVFSAARPPSGKPLLLPALGDADVGVRDAPPGSRWSVLFSPALLEFGTDIVQYGIIRANVDSASGPGVVRIGEHRFELDATERLHAWLPRGHLGGVDVDGHGFQVRLVGHDDNHAIVPVPATLEAECTRRLPGFEVAVVEVGGARATVAGHCSLNGQGAGPYEFLADWEQHKDFTDGNVVFDEAEMRPGVVYSLVVQLADGEWFHRDVPFEPVDGMQRVTVTRGEGKQPLRLRLPGVPSGSLHGAAFEYGDGSIQAASPRSMYWTSKQPVFTHDGDVVAVSVLPDDWRLAWVVLSDGRVGTVSRESVAAVTDVAWLPAGPTQTVDVMALYRDYGDRMSMAVYLEVELVGSRGQSAWHCIATHRRFHRVERTVPPVWSGLQLPAALKGRLRLYGSDEPDFANAEAHEIPLPRR